MKLMNAMPAAAPTRAHSQKPTQPYTCEAGRARVRLNRHEDTVLSAEASRLEPDGEERRHPHRRRRLPRAQRGDPRRRAPRRRGGLGRRRGARGLARARRADLRGSRPVSRCRGSSRAAARSSARAARTRSRSRAASSACCQNFRDRGLDALVAIGGEDTLGVAARLHAEQQLPVVGVPKTIDNDLSGTDYTFGFDTAVFVATEAIDRLHTTAESHNRVMVVEVMGRHTGWIAVMSGIAGGADVILVPEIPVDFDEVAETIRKRHARGKNFSIVVVSEGCELPGLADAGEQDQFGHVILSKRGVGDALGREIEERTGFETRVTVLGHVQRGGTPTPRDRVLATRFGLKAADLALAGRVRADGRAARRRRRRRAARRGDGRAEGRARASGTTSRARSSASAPRRRSRPAPASRGSRPRRGVCRGAGTRARRRPRPDGRASGRP